MCLDNDSVAKRFQRDIRVLCWVMTSAANLYTKAIHVRETWGKRCNTVLFVSDKEDKNFPTVPLMLRNVGYDHLTAKTMKAFDYIFQHYYDAADWFLKADDDTYVIVENLRYLLSTHNTTKPVYFGHHFKSIVRQGYFSGGAGYVVSREALRRFAMRSDDQCNSDLGAEDVKFGECMEKLGVEPVDSRDILGRSRFHCFDPGSHIHGAYPDWYYTYDKYGAKRVSRYTQHSVQCCQKYIVFSMCYKHFVNLEGNCIVNVLDFVSAAHVRI